MNFLTEIHSSALEENCPACLQQNINLTLEHGGENIIVCFGIWTHYSHWGENKLTNNNTSEKEETLILKGPKQYPDWNWFSVVLGLVVQNPQNGCRKHVKEDVAAYHKRLESHFDIMNMPCAMKGSSFFGQWNVKCDKTKTITLLN